MPTFFRSSQSQTQSQVQAQAQAQAQAQSPSKPNFPPNPPNRSNPPNASNQQYPTSSSNSTALGSGSGSGGRGGRLTTPPSPKSAPPYPQNWTLQQAQAQAQGQFQGQGINWTQPHSIPNAQEPPRSTGTGMGKKKIRGWSFSSLAQSSSNSHSHSNPGSQADHTGPPLGVGQSTALGSNSASNSMSISNSILNPNSNQTQTQLKPLAPDPQPQLQPQPQTQKMSRIEEGIVTATASASGNTSASVSGRGERGGSLPSDPTGRDRSFIHVPVHLQDQDQDQAQAQGRGEGRAEVGHGYTRSLSKVEIPFNPYSILNPSSTGLDSNSNSNSNPNPNSSSNSNFNHSNTRPKPRGLSDSGKDKRRAGWFGLQLDQTNSGSGSGSGLGAGEWRSRKESGGEEGQGPGPGQTQSQGQGQVDQMIPGQGIGIGLGINRSGSLSFKGLKSKVGVGLGSASGFGSGLGSTSTSASTSTLGGNGQGTGPTVGGMTISGPIGPMIKASQEEILEEFDRLNVMTGSNPAPPSNRGRNAFQGQRSASFGTEARPSFSSSFDEMRGETLERIQSRNAAATPSTVQIPSTPTRQISTIEKGTPKQNHSYSPMVYPTPLSPPVRKTSTPVRPLNPRPPVQGINFPWPARGVEAGSLSPRQLSSSRKDSYESSVEGHAQGLNPSPTLGRKSPVRSVEWLARKPSTTFDPGYSGSTTTTQMTGKLHDLGPPVGLYGTREERPIKRKPIPLFPPSHVMEHDGPVLRKRGSDDSEDHKYATSGIEGDEDSEEQLSELEDAVITRAERVTSPRTGSFSSATFSVGTPPKSPATVPVRDRETEFQVETVCVPSADADVMRWEVVIRRKPATGSQTGQTGATPMSIPVQLSSSRTTATAPASASSLNLSLSLDQPSGKLVFLSLPTSVADPNATPCRTRTASQVGSGLSKARIDRSPSPSPSHATVTFNRSMSGPPILPPSHAAYHTFNGSPRPRYSIAEARRQFSASTPSTANYPLGTPMSPGFPITPTSPPSSPREVVVKQRRKASLQGGILYTRQIDA